MILYDYWRSSAAYRVRIALAFKGVPFDQAPVHLVRDGGEHRTPAYRAINPQGRVPALRLDDGTVLIQSSAIIEWLEETRPEPPLLPADPLRRARARAIAAIVGCDIHPVNNTGTLAALRDRFGADEDAIAAWIRHWIGEGFSAIERLIEGPFAAGDAPTIADVFLVPQVYNARRFGTDLGPYPKLLATEARAAALPAFAAAHPDRQPGAG